DRECQQHIPRHTTPLTIARVRVEHAADDGRSAIVKGAAVGLYSVDRGVILRGVVIPQHLAIVGRIGAQVAIDRTGEYHPRNHRDRRRLGGTTVWPITTSWRRHRPYFFPCG